MVVEEEVASSEDVDRMWDLHQVGGPPFRLMERVGLDVVLNIEEHYAQVRECIREGPRTSTSGLAVLLVFIGAKFMLSEVVDIGVGIALLVIVFVMTAAIAASLLRERHHA